MRKIFGVGVNDSKDPTQEEEFRGGKRVVVWRCPYYQVFTSIYRRSYSEFFHKKHPTYKDCTVDPRWRNFTDFKLWMESQKWEGMDIDKDLLIPDNKVYGPSTCLFLEPPINTFVSSFYPKKGNLTGVSIHKRTGMWVSQCHSPGLFPRHRGLFNTEEEAHRAWVIAKWRVGRYHMEDQSKLVSSYLLTLMNLKLGPEEGIYDLSSRKHNGFRWLQTYRQIPQGYL